MLGSCLGACRFWLAPISLLGLCASPATAQQLISPVGDQTRFEIGYASENVGRGLSYTKEHPTLFSSASMRRGWWEITAGAIGVDGPGAHVELSARARLTAAFAGATTYIGVERTIYPGADLQINYWEVNAGAERRWHGGSVQVGLRWSPDDSGGAEYIFVEASKTLSTTSMGQLELRGRYGFRSYDDTLAGTPDYRHWSLGLALSHGPATLDLTYHDTDLETAVSFPSDPRLVARVTYRLLDD